MADSRGNGNSDGVRGKGEDDRSTPPSVEEVRPHHARFWRALQEEILATVKEDKRRAVAVESGRPVEGAPGCFRFEVKTSTHGFSAGDRIVARLGTTEIDGRVVEAGNELTLDLGCLLQLPKSSGRVRPDTAWLTATIRDRITATIRALQQDRQPDPQFNFDLALRVLGDREPSGPNSGPTGQTIPGPGTALNPEQREAVRRSLASEVLYVWGPPGTGKSTTLGALASAHARSGKSVLVVAASNQAVDVATQKIADRLDNERLKQGELVRVGPGLTDQVSASLRRHVRPDERVRRENARRENARDRLERMIHRAETSRLVLLRRARDGLADFLGPVLSEATKRRLESPLRTHQRALSELEDQPVSTPSEIAAEARIVVTTAHQALLSPTRSELFDTVVIDEASMLAQPTVYLMAGRARQHAVVLGDCQQLPPVTTGNGADDVLTTDVFQRAGIPDAVEHGEEPANLVTLRTQYRMKPAICQLAGKIFYGDRLQTAQQVRKRGAPNTPLGQGSLYCLDTSSFAPRVRRTGNGSRENLAHARVVIAVLDYLLLGPDGRPEPDAGPVAVLTPFVAQRELVRGRIRHRYPADQVPVSTTHGAQGDEYGIVVLDLVDAKKGLPVSRYLQADCLTATGARLLNVGLTRARDQLVVVGDLPYLAQRGGRVVKALVRALAFEATRLDGAHIGKGSKAMGA